MGSSAYHDFRPCSQHYTDDTLMPACQDAQYPPDRARFSPVPSMRRPPLVKRVLDRSWDRLRAILPSALLVSLLIGSVHFEVRRGPVLPSPQLPRHEQVQGGQRDRPQSPGPGGQARSLFHPDRIHLLCC